MLGMYDMPPLRAANDRYWAGIRAHLGYGPPALSRTGDFWQMWRNPGLVLGQTCGLPYRTRLHDRVTLVGTPDYGLPDCPPGHYRSVLVARGNDRRGLRDLIGGTFAYNEALSQSGWAAPVTHLAHLGLRPVDRIETGGHALSAVAVADGRADLAALDQLTWTLLCEHDPVAGALRVVDTTTPTPGLPYITAAGRDAAALARAVSSAIADLDPGDRDLLHLRALVAIPASAYLAVPTPPLP